ncbi:MAG: CPBP family intramembrane metalloprotease [Clostridiales bacterium]|nr:CPBP family intramembrane metalloprotease [Clostridiales bacterium]
MLGLASAVQSAGYGLIFGAAGIWLGKKVGLWKDERHITKKPLLAALIISLIGGLGLIFPDLLFFGKYEPALLDVYAAKPTIPYLLATVTYGAVIEEIMLRLFMMSLVAFVLHLLFERKGKEVGTAVLVAANVVSALLFAAGHLPATEMMFGLTPMIVLRCFLLNGVFGLAFGWLYRRFGLRYAMIAHGGCHVVSKLIWILFI